MPTKVEVETILVGRTKSWLSLAQLSTVTDGNNPDIAEPITRSIREVGGTTVSLGTYTQDDLNTVPAEKMDAFLDLAEIHILEKCAGTTGVINSQAERVSSKDLTVEKKSGTMSLTDWLKYLIDRFNDRYPELDLTEEFIVSGSSIDLGIRSRSW